MKRRTLLQALGLAAVFPLIPACFRAQVIGEAINTYYAPQQTPQGMA